MNRLEARDPSFFSKAAFAGTWAAAAGLTTGVATATGVKAINQLTVSTGKKFEGVKVDVPIEVILDSGQSLTVILQMQHSSASASGFSSLGDAATTTVQNATTATGVVSQGIASVSASLVNAKKFVRVQATRQGSAADTGGDITASAFTANFFGANEEAA